MLDKKEKKKKGGGEKAWEIWDDLMKVWQDGVGGKEYYKLSHAHGAKSIKSTC